MQVTHGNRFRYASVETFRKAIRVLTSKLKHFETYRKSFIAFISKVVKNNVLHCDSFIFGFTRQCIMRFLIRLRHQKLNVQRNWQHRIYKAKTNKTKTQHNMCWTHYTQTNTNNVNKTWSLLQTTGGKDEPNTVFMRNS